MISVIRSAPDKNSTEHLWASFDDEISRKAIEKPSKKDLICAFIANCWISQTNK